MEALGKVDSFLDYTKICKETQWGLPFQMVPWREVSLSASPWTSDWAAVRIQVRPRRGGSATVREDPEARCSRDGPPPPYAVTHRCQMLSSQRGPRPEENSGLFPSPEGREEKGVWGPKKEAEAAPPALGKEATSASTPGEGQRSERRDLCWCLLLSFSIRKEVGGGFPAGPPGGPAVGWCPVQATGSAGQVVAHPREGIWGPTPGVW